MYTATINFLWGQVDASVGDLTLTMFTPENSIAILQIKCTDCEYEETELDDNINYIVAAMEVAVSTSKWISIEYPNNNMKTSKGSSLILTMVICLFISGGSSTLIDFISQLALSILMAVCSIM